MQRLGSGGLLRSEVSIRKSPFKKSQPRRQKSESWQSRKSQQLKNVDHDVSRNLGLDSQDPQAHELA